MDRKAIIDGLKMTKELCVFDPSTGEEIEPHLLNDISRATYDACKGALEILERLDTDSDTISRQSAINKIVETSDEIYKIKQKGATYPHDDFFQGMAYAENIVKQLPPAQPERTCVNCGRTANNGGWYADGRTRCPIEEHYALPKDGYCHLWEKRNVTDDDYPERRTDE